MTNRTAGGGVTQKHKQNQIKGQSLKSKSNASGDEEPEDPEMEGHLNIGEEIPQIGLRKPKK